MAKNQRLAELAVEAEKAVAGVKDPELRRIAYQRILDDLIGAPSAASSREPSAKKAQPHRNAEPAMGRKVHRRGGPAAYLQELVDENFFKKPKTMANVKAELSNRGHHIPLTSLSGPLQSLCQRRILRRAREAGPGKKNQFAYSNW